MFELLRHDKKSYKHGPNILQVPLPVCPEESATHAKLSLISINKPITPKLEGHCITILWKWKSNKFKNKGVTHMGDGVQGNTRM